MILSGEAVRSAEKRLRSAGIDTARLDAFLLVAAALRTSTDQVRLTPTLPLPPAAEGRLMTLLARRADKREPISRILGEREFWSLPFKLAPATLDPRPDTETLIDVVLKAIPDRNAPLRLLDLGTGTGCILLALLSELPNAIGIGVDISGEAVGIADENARALKLENRADFVAADWNQPDWQMAVARTAGISETDGLPEPLSFDWVLSNPPYIKTDQITGLAPEVATHDPHAALDGGADGLEAFRAIVPQLRNLLAPNGQIAFEMGDGQGAALSALLHETEPTVVSISNDLTGRARCMVAKY